MFILTTKIRYLLPVLFSLLLTGCNQPVDNPKTVADKYWQHIQAGNLVEAEKLATANSQTALQQHQQRLSANTSLSNDNATTTVTTTITTVDPSTNYQHQETFSTVLVIHQGQWKVDANRSTIPPEADAQEKEIQQLSDEFAQSMQENVKSLDEAMTKGMQMLNETLRDSSQEMGGTLLNLMNKLNSTMQKSIENMEQRREQQIQENEQEQQKKQQQPVQPDSSQGEGMI